MTAEDFLIEVKDQFKRHLQSRYNLDSKAGHMMTVSGTIIAILGGLMILLIDFVKLSLPFTSITFGALFAGIFFMIITILFSIRAYTVRNQLQPIIHEPFFENNGKGEYNSKIAEEYINLTKTQMTEIFIHTYLEGIRSAAIAVEEKSKHLKWSEITFVIGIIFILITGIFLFASISEIPNNIPNTNSTLTG